MRDIDLSGRPDTASWLTPEAYWPGLSRATAELETPVAALHLDALRFNAHQLRARAAGSPIRVATKSIRVRGVIEALLARPGFSGVLAYTLAESLWLADTVDDILVGYPTADRAGILRLGRSPELAAKVTLMVDSLTQLDFIDSVLPPRSRSPIRVCLELDSAWDAPLFGHIGVRRSPVHTAEQARALAVRIVSRPGFRLVGMMGYEAQVAGIRDRPPGRTVQGAINRFVRRRSIAELRERRGRAVAAVREVAELEFVNGGGTGSLESTHADASVTDIAAGSGLFGGHLFDGYSGFSVAPAAAFALSVVRKPAPDTAVLLGGGWIASGPAGRDRMPQPVWPEGLRYRRLEMAGEVQTPVTGRQAERLAVGDRVWLRHAKSGELSEHVREFALVHDGQVVDLLPTYRGDGKAFL